MKTPILHFLLVIFLIGFTNCTSSSVNSREDVYKNQVGLLRWGGTPEADGAGMLFIVDEVEYGVPGTPEDYPKFFQERTIEVNVRADFKLTGEKTVRGWGATFPEIEILRIEKM